MIVETKPYSDQNMGTSGLRKKTEVFLNNPNYLENFIQSIFNALSAGGKKIIVGGDGRYYNDVAIQTIIKMAVANGISEIWVAQNGLISTPAVSCIIRKYGLDFGILLTASHNPGGPDGDFGIKVNNSSGAPAPEDLTQKIVQESMGISSYLVQDIEDIDLSIISDYQKGQTRISVINTTKDYIDLMKEIFDFDAIRQMIANGCQITFDAMHGATGIYANEIFVKELGVKSENIWRSNSLPDFGGGHPDPNMIYNKKLVDFMFSDKATDFAAACDADGDRCMILGRDVFVSPNDSLAVLCQNHHLIKGYKNGISGVARSLPTSRAVDFVAKDVGLCCYETPTGWKYFGNLLDANKISICGEESFGAGSNHIREKDGIWVALYWLNIMATAGKNVSDVCVGLWQKYGRFYTLRQDYENLPEDSFQKVWAQIKKSMVDIGKDFNGNKLLKADDFEYLDPISGQTTSNQGLCFYFEDGRIVFRVSGTGTSGKTIRIYLERKMSEYEQKTLDVLDEYRNIAEDLCQISRITGRIKPDVLT